MTPRSPAPPYPPPALAKAATGIAGLDEVTRGGLPAGRTTLICGGPGCGKTMLAMELLVHGARRFDEPGVFVSFEESPEELEANCQSCGFGVAELRAQGKLAVLEVRLDPGPAPDCGEFTLDALLLRLEHAIAERGAKRVVLDTLDGLFSGLPRQQAVRAELLRVLRWLKQRGITAAVTAERGDTSLTRHELEEYVSDCVVLLDHRVVANIAKRRLRIVKYRGSTHGLDEYPFLIGPRGIEVFPVSSVEAANVASTQTVSSGVPDLDSMLGQDGFYRGSSVLISGTAGAGKSTLAAAFAHATCERGERCLYFAFEESANQIVRNMRSVGIDLAPSIESGLLQVHAVRPSLFGLEEHLVTIMQATEQANAQAMVLDPISNFASVGETLEVKSMLLRVFERLRARGMTVLVTSLTDGATSASGEFTNTEVSSLMDTWIVLRHLFQGHHRRRWLHVAKSRGMASSQQVRELQLSSSGVALQPISAPLEQELPPERAPR